MAKPSFWMKYPRWVANTTLQHAISASLINVSLSTVLCSVRKSEIDERLTIINGLNDNLKFTCELENEGTIPFLDMLILNANGTLSSSWYRKPSDTGLTLNFHALAPRKRLYERSMKG